MSLLFSSFSALWIGILASVSPCPLASNIAAFSFIEKDCGDNRSVLLSGAAYALGKRSREPGSPLLTGTRTWIR